MASDIASIASSEYQKLGFREKILALKKKAPLAAGERTDPAFENSFGDRLSDLGGKRRWVLVGLALQKWHHDLQPRVDEVLRESEGEIYKGWSIRATRTVCRCWMLGQDQTSAQPTVVIACSQSKILKRSCRVVSQHGVLKSAKFALKAIPSCDLTLRTDRRVSFLSGEDYTLSEDGDTRRGDHGHPIRGRELGSENQREHDTIDEMSVGLKEQDEEEEGYEKNMGEGNGMEKDLMGMTVLSEKMPLQHDVETSEEDYVPLRFGAEEIFVPESGRPTTLGGFIMVDDVCFGLTTAHAFTEEDEGFGARSISGSVTEIPLYDSDWANEDSSDNDSESDGLDLHREPSRERRLQRRRKSRLVEDQTYYTTAWNPLHIIAYSRLTSTEGLDWALCELGDWGRYAINGVHLRPELRSAGMPEHLLFRNIKSTAPLGKILVATRRGAVPGIGTGSDCSIKLARDSKYRRVWSVEVEESLSSGDSGSWVVDAETGDVYGMIVAGSTALREEYVIPAVDVGQDICRALRADSVRLPSIQDVTTAHIEERSVRPTLTLTDESTDWESDDSDDSDETLNEEAMDKDEERFLLTEVLKHSSIDTETLIKVIKDAGVRPKWTKMSLPKGQSLKTAQRALDRLLSNRNLRETVAQDDREFVRAEVDCPPSQIPIPQGQQVPPPSTTQRYDLSFDQFLEQKQDTRQHQEAGQDVVPGLEERLISENASKKGEPKISLENSKSVENITTLPTEAPPKLLDSNPNFRAGMSRRAWRAKQQAERGPKHHRRKTSRKSGENIDPDPTLQAPDLFESQSPSYQSKFEIDSEDDPGNDEPDIILVRHKGSLYKLKFPAFSLAEGQTLVGHLRQQAATEFDVEDISRVTLVFQGKTLKSDTKTCHEEGLKMRSEVLCVVKRTPLEEIDFLTHKFRTELVPQGLEFISNTPTDAKKRDLEYRRSSETILTQVLLKSDAVDTEGDSEARLRRKELVKEVQGFLADLDKAANRDVPSAWHADFIEPKQTPGIRRPSATLPGRPAVTRSRSSKLDRSDSNEYATSETNAD